MATVEELHNASRSIYEKLVAMRAQMGGVLKLARQEEAYDAICVHAAELASGLANFERNSTAGAAAPSSQSARPRAAGAAAPSSQAPLPPPPPPQQEPTSPRRYLTYDAEQYLHCRLCQKQAADSHLQSVGHRRRVENICHYMHYVLPKDLPVH